jgi:hypothetical protein
LKLLAELRLCLFLLGKAGLRREIPNAVNPTVQTLLINFLPGSDAGTVCHFLS